MSARSTRDALKRTLGQALNSCEKIHFHLETLLLQFDAHNSHLDEYLRTMMTHNAQLHEHLLRFWELAWGKRPEDFNVWR